MAETTEGSQAFSVVVREALRVPLRRYRVPRLDSPT